MKFIWYSLVISWRTIWGYFLVLFHLGINKYPSSVYFNVTLMVPMFLDYRDLVGVRYSKALRKTIRVCALMLLQDIALDEEGVTCMKLDAIFSNPNEYNPTSQIELQIKELLINDHNSLGSDHLRLLHTLNSTQIQSSIAQDYSTIYTLAHQKGIWFPALAHAFNPNMSQGEIRVLTMLGFWIKCVDDLADLNEDRRNQTHSIYSHPDTDLLAKQHLEQLRIQAFQEARKLPYLEVRIKRFLYRISIATYTFKLHNDLFQKMPRWYQRVLNLYQPLQFINVVIASLLGFKQLNKIQ